MKKKFRKHKNKRKNDFHKLLIPVKQKIKKQVVFTHYKDMNLSETDRINYVYKLNNKYEKVEITCISYDILIGNNWTSIEIFDTTHGYLHHHVLVKIGEKPRVIIPTNLKKNDSIDYLFNWVEKQLLNNWYYYRRHFIKNNKKELKGLIDNY